MELAVPSFVFTPGRLLPRTDCLGPVDCRIRENPARPIRFPHIAGSDSWVLDMRNTKQLQRFYVVEVFRPQPLIPGSQGSETVSLPCGTSAFDRRQYSIRDNRMLIEGASPSIRNRSRFPLHPNRSGYGWSI